MEVAAVVMSKCAAGWFFFFAPTATNLVREKKNKNIYI
jgi:hypothetical protein